MKDRWQCMHNYFLVTEKLKLRYYLAWGFLLLYTQRLMCIKFIRENSNLKRTKKYYQEGLKTLSTRFSLGDMHAKLYNNIKKDARGTCPTTLGPWFEKVEDINLMKRT